MQGPTKSNSGAKESLSVYGLFHHLARTPQGKMKLRQIFMRPSMDMDLIRERHTSIATFLRPDNLEALQDIVASLKKIKNIKTVLIHLTKGINTAKASAFKQGVWGSLQQFTFHALKIMDVVKTMIDGQSVPILTKAGHHLKLKVKSH
jgi:DNA mismatch repair protein MSH5